MKLDNRTRWRAGAYISWSPYGRYGAVVVLKTGYRLGPEGGAEPLDKPPRLNSGLKFSATPPLCDLVHDTDMVMFKPHADVILTGAIRPPENRPRGSWTVSARLGERVCRMTASGPRFWIKEGAGWVISPPQPTDSIPLSFTMAFGGARPKAPDAAADGAGEDLDSEAGPEMEYYLPNPIGRGYALPADGAEPVPLPQLEHAEHLIAAPEDEPPPRALTWVSPFFAGRAEKMVDKSLAEESRLRERLTFSSRPQGPPDSFVPPGFKWAAFNAADPDLTVPYPNGGEEFELTGVCAAGALRLTVPRVTYLVKSDLGHRSWLNLDTIVALLDDREAHLVYRANLPLHREREFALKLELSELN